ncbi:MAG: transcription termination/antitermination protein NusG [Clostridia bacterium]|nr:transcription termination/antitermination protein NusG [Clostridia bacterium]
MAANKASRNAKWYVVHTYSGYENKVKTNLEKAIENRNLEDLIVDIRVPTEEVLETKGDEQRTVTRKIFPGYVLIKMIMTDDTWYIVRNTTGVTGFVGPASKPVPLTEEEVESLGVEVREMNIEYGVGDNVRIITGAFANQIGLVDSIDMAARKVSVSVVMFGRKTPLELDMTSVESI